MSTFAPTAENSSDTTAAQPTTIQTERATPVALDGATAIFVPAYTRTDDGHALEQTRDELTHLVGVYSEPDVRKQLGEEYEPYEIERAIERGERMTQEHQENVLAAIRVAEQNEERDLDRGEGVMADGGALTVHDGDTDTTETIEADGGEGDSDNAERLARGEAPLPDAVNGCQYCGADRDAMHCTEEDSHVAPHSHHGARHTVISCDECDGAHITVSQVQTRVNRPSRPTHTKSIWVIPDEFVLCVCMDGHIVDRVEKVGRGEEFYTALLDGELNCECGATVTHVEGRFERNADGTPVEPLPEPDH
ncbi:hypothetical protein [Halococcus saccharolyticus]|uniref:Uncharacterized protein n=1 Tax=Halococcus saccharolyticus DSM 5350 TaxID=1227455 RepID=M0MU26_9EURY|nr:hypothetical protein [Halococcus saccharolyticus]EMA47955.1 hypothetical protein C449_00745 [Halococcus saccharolyticus DSM 5350]